MGNSANERRRGVIILSMGRSGTNWLKSIGVNAGRMGMMSESLGFNKLENPRKSYTAQSFYDFAMQHSSTANQRFSMKIFPRQIRNVQTFYGFDFIRKCLSEHDVKLYLVTREDRLGQAISVLKAKQSKEWSSQSAIKNQHERRPIRYNFKRLCKYYFELGQGFDFWRSYLSVHNHDFEAFNYETLLPDPAPFFKSVAQHLDVPPPESYQSPLKIQRDALTVEWRQRFQEDLAREGLHPVIYDLKPPQANLKNALRLLGNRPLRPEFGEL